MLILFPINQIMDIPPMNLQADYFTKTLIPVEITTCSKPKNPDNNYQGSFIFYLDGWSSKNAFRLLMASMQF